MSYKNKTVISSSDMQTHDLCVLSLYMYTSIIISMMMLLPAVMALHHYVIIPHTGMIQHVVIVLICYTFIHFQQFLF